MKNSKERLCDTDVDLNASVVELVDTLHLRCSSY